MMTDKKPADHKPDDLAAKLEKLEEAGELPDDAATIAADDQGASALAQKLGKLDERERR